MPVEQFQIDYVVSGRDLLQSTNLTNKQSPAILFSDPDSDYDLDAKQVLNAVKLAISSQPSASVDKSGSPEATLSKVPRLPATAIEAAAIALKSYKPLQLRNRSVLLINMLKKPLSKRSSVRRSW